MNKENRASTSLSDFWYCLGNEFRHLYAVCPVLRADWLYIVGSGEPEWRIAGDSDAAIQFEALAKRAASRLPGSGDLLSRWLEALKGEGTNFEFEHGGSEPNPDGSETEHMSGTILRVSEASAMSCSTLEGRAIETEWAQQQAAHRPEDADRPSQEPIDLVSPATPNRSLDQENAAMRAAAQHVEGTGVSAQGLTENRRRSGRRPNPDRREAIHSAIAKHGEQWRDHLHEILTDLDNDEVPMDHFYGSRIDLGSGASQTACKWVDLDLDIGKQRRRVIDAFRHVGDGSNSPTELVPDNSN